MYRWVSLLFINLFLLTLSFPLPSVPQPRRSPLPPFPTASRITPSTLGSASRHITRAVEPFPCKFEKLIHPLKEGSIRGRRSRGAAKGFLVEHGWIMRYNLALTHSKGSNLIFFSSSSSADSAPVLEYRFISQTLQPGPSVSLKCIASGAPTPHVSWALDGFPLPQLDRLVLLSLLLLIVIKLTMITLLLSRPYSTV